MRNKRFKNLLLSIMLLQVGTLGLQWHMLITAENASALEYEPFIFEEQENNLGDITTLDYNYSNTPKTKTIDEVTIYTQSYEDFKTDNVNFRNNEYYISFKGEYYEYDVNSDDIIYYPIIFVGDKIKEDYNISSGDILSFYSTDYTVIDNKSNCNNFTDDYCVEILSEKQFLDNQNIILKKEEE